MAENAENQRDLRKKRREITPDRLPPHDPESEQAVLGCILLDPSTCLPIALEKLRGGAATFYDLRHQTIFETFSELFEDGITIDVITTQARLKLWGKLEQVGGISYLSELPDVVPSSANMPNYVEILNDKYSIRQMIAACTEVVGELFESEGKADEILDRVERRILRISESRVSSPDTAIRSLVVQAMGQIEQSYNRKGAVSGIATGFVDLDGLMGGMEPAEVIIIAGRPSTGKTALAMNIAEYVSVDLKIPVGVLSLEMQNVALVKRMLCSRARVNFRNVRDGFLAQRDFPKLTISAGNISSAPIYIDDSAGISILQARAKGRRMWQQFGIKLLVVDYLQLMHSNSKRAGDNRQQEVADISAGIKNLAKELGIPVIVLSQLNREIDRDKTRKPRLSDLRESGNLEADGDKIAMLYRPRMADDAEDPDSAEAVPMNLYLAKNRNGPVGDVQLVFLKSFTRFESAAKLSDEDVPETTQTQMPMPDP